MIDAGKVKKLIEDAGYKVYDYGFIDMAMFNCISPIKLPNMLFILFKIECGGKSNREVSVELKKYLERNGINTGRVIILCGGEDV